ncbi:NmrA-domain-containing protein [Phellopilus nigrolimitatus]|nr:NmrA-domain-containing protein [Phellopilus nigrolimitatus]
MTNEIKPLIVVTAATGAQGSSVVDYLLKDGSFRVRAVTRNTDSEKARALVARGAEVVSANYNDPEAVRKAFEGAYGVFGNTTYWEAMNANTETEHGKMLVDAAKAAGVKHFVWSTLEHSDVPHGESKALVDDYLQSSGLPRTSLVTAFYYENFYIFPDMALKKNEAGKLVAHWPLLWTDGPLGAFSVAETGAYVLAAFKNPKEWIGNDIRLLSEIINPRGFVETLRRVSGADVELIETSKADFDGLEETAMGYDNEGNASGDPELTKRLNPTRATFEEFIKVNLDKFVPR